jgi:hypothetical protein
MQYDAFLQHLQQVPVLTHAIVARPITRANDDALLHRIMFVRRMTAVGQFLPIQSRRSFADDDPLVFNVSSDPISSKKIDPVEPIGFQIGPHPIESRTIEQCAGVPVVNVFRGKHMACDSDLSFQVHKLALYRPFLLLRVWEPEGRSPEGRVGVDSARRAIC